MKIAIISDVHNNIANLEKVLDYCRSRQTEKIICCGDLASEETLDYLCDNFSGEIYYAFGNMDNGQLRNLQKETGYKNAKIFAEYGEITIAAKKIAFVHFPEIAGKLCRTGKYDYVFYGHTHKPWQEETNGCLLLNPGNVAGEIFPPTFAFWETDKNFILKLINEL
jgi:putative phosphoesterase